MTDFTSSTPEAPTKQISRWKPFIAITAVINIAVLVGCPGIFVPPGIARQLPRFIVAEVILVIPFLWSVFLLLRYRTFGERLIGYCSLAVSVFWLFAGASYLDLMY